MLVFPSPIGSDWRVQLYPLWRPGPAATLVALWLLAGCTLPFDVLGGRRPPPPPKSASWETDTEAGAQAFEEGRLEEAEQRLELARERAATGAEDKLAVAASLSNLAVVRRAQGDIAGAIDLQQEALAIRETALGPNHLEVAATLNSLGGLYGLSDDYSAAEPLLVRALAIREQSAGADDRRTGESVNNLALLYAAQGRHADAEPLYQRAIIIFEQRQRPVELATTLENYAASLADSGRADEAADVEQRARSLREPAGAPVTDAPVTGEPVSR
jgi:tetratricopeptide (TPR) repeat protein